MKRELAEQLEAYYRGPMPQRKKEFLAGRHVRRQFLTFARVQFQYIPKTAWALSLLLFVLMLTLGRFLDVQRMGCVYAFVPFLCASTVSTGMRSLRCRMAELESATLYSFGSIFMMRMLLLGAGNFLVLVLLAACGKAPYFLSELMYLLAPYMLTAGGSLMVYRRAPQRDAAYMSLAVSPGVAALELSTVGSGIYSAGRTGIWVLLCVLLLVFAVVQMRKSARIMEDAVWN